MLFERVKLSNKRNAILLLVIVFVVLYVATFAAISTTNTAYSTPQTVPTDVYRNNSRIPIAVGIGPCPNAIDVPLNTAIVVFQLRSCKIENLELTPYVPILGRSDQAEGPASGITTFYPAVPLEPNTTYNVSVTVIDTVLSWVFTTTVDSFQPSISYYLATYALGIAVVPATIGACIVGKMFFINVQKSHTCYEAESNC